MVQQASIINKITRRLKQYRDGLLLRPGLTKCIANARGARIIIYHGICQTNHTRFNNIFLTFKTFKSHLDYYKKYFNVISLDDYYQQRFSQSKFNICLSFDDGFANNHKYVLPLIEEYKLPATFFVTGIRQAGYDILWNDFLSQFSSHGPERINFKGDAYIKDKTSNYIHEVNGQRLADILRGCNFEAKKEMMQALYPLFRFKEIESNKDYWLQMTVEQIQQLAASQYATIGSHSYYHNDLALTTGDELRDELVLSKQFLEEVIQKEVTSLAFPYGSYNQQTVTMAKEAGYTELLAMDFNNRSDAADAAMRERFTVNPFVLAGNQMYANIKGNYE